MKREEGWREGRGGERGGVERGEGRMFISTGIRQSVYLTLLVLFER